MAAKRKPRTGAVSKKPSSKTVASFLRALTPSPALAAIVGPEPLPRTEVIKRVWQYIKKHGLQDRKDRRMINADDALLEVLGKPKVDLFELAQLVNQHLE